MDDQEFTRQKVCYQEHYEAFRRLNETMWKIPVILMTLTGGAWYGAANPEISPGVSFFLFLIAGIANFTFIIILSRVRHIMALQLFSLKEFAQDHHIAADHRGSFLETPKLAARCIAFLLAITGLSSIILSISQLRILFC